MHNAEQKGEKLAVEDFGASFIKAVTDCLIKNTLAAAEETGSKKIVLAGGVSANSRLRSKMKTECEKRGIRLFMPDKSNTNLPGIDRQTKIEKISNSPRALRNMPEGARKRGRSRALSRLPRYARSFCIPTLLLRFSQKLPASARF